MRSNVINRYLNFIYNVRVTLQNEFYNILAYTAVKVPRQILNENQIICRSQNTCIYLDQHS